MVTLKDKPRVTSRWARLEEINQKLSDQVEEILEASKEAADSEKPESSAWHYTVPFAGVRYYGF